MSFDPYLSYYLPIVAAPEDLQFWEASLSQSPNSPGSEDISSKELFIKNCILNFDEKAYAILTK